MATQKNQNRYVPPVKKLGAIGARKTLLMIFVVDHSGSMTGERIKAVNQAFERMIPELQQVQSSANDTFRLEIAVMVFGSVAEWIVPPTPIGEYIHTEIKADGGGTSYGNAFRKLEEKLSRKEYFPSEGKIAKPYIMFMTDGKPLDSDYEAMIQKLENNLWYTQAQRYAVLMGKEAIQDPDARAAVSAFVQNNSESIITAKNAEEITKTVSATTILAVNEMTHLVPPEQAEPQPEQEEEEDLVPPVKWDFGTDLTSLYGKDYKF